jgi:hypothetical protein
VNQSNDYRVVWFDGSVAVSDSGIKFITVSIVLRDYLADHIACRMNFACGLSKLSNKSIRPDLL